MNVKMMLSLQHRLSNISNLEESFESTPQDSQEMHLMFKLFLSSFASPVVVFGAQSLMQSLMHMAKKTDKTSDAKRGRKWKKGGRWEILRWDRMLVMGKHHSHPGHPETEGKVCVQTEKEETASQACVFLPWRIPLIIPLSLPLSLTRGFFTFTASSASWKMTIEGKTRKRGNTSCKNNVKNNEERSQCSKDKTQRQVRKKEHSEWKQMGL